MKVVTLTEEQYALLKEVLDDELERGGQPPEYYAKREALWHACAGAETVDAIVETNL